MMAVQRLASLFIILIHIVKSEPCIDLSIYKFSKGCEVVGNNTLCYQVHSLDKIRDAVQADELLLVQCDIENFNLKDFPIRLRNILVVGSTIRKMDAEAYKTLTNLEELSFKDSEIKETNSKHLRGAMSLKRFYLENSSTFTIFSNAFTDLQELAKLEINKHNITNLQKDLFTGLNNLKILTLQNNPLKYIHSLTFDPLTSLESLNLEGCEISSLHTSFGGLKNLKDLNLNSNQLKTLIPEGFSNDLAALEYLYFTANQIEEVHVGAFKELTSLKVLALDNNKISTLDVGVFDGLVNVKMISLMNNRLTDLSVETFRNLPNIAVLQLDHDLKLKEKEFLMQNQSVAIIANGLYKRRYC